MSERPYRWKGEELAALKTAYETSGLMVADLAVDFRTSPGNICRLSSRHGWKRRGAVRLPASARQHWKLYRKVQAISGRETALEAVGT